MKCFFLAFRIIKFTSSAISCYLPCTFLASLGISLIFSPFSHVSHIGSVSWINDLSSREFFLFCKTFLKHETSLGIFTHSKYLSDILMMFSLRVLLPRKMGSQISSPAGASFYFFKLTQRNCKKIFN